MDDLEKDIGDLNVKMCHAGDPARIRYAWIEADPYLDDTWVVITIWELPDFADDDPGGWPYETRDRYFRLLAEHYSDNFDVLTHCVFRTAAQLADPAQQRGQPILEPA